MLWIQIHVHEPYSSLKKLQFLMYISVTYFTEGVKAHLMCVMQYLTGIFNKQLLSSILVQKQKNLRHWFDTIYAKIRFRIQKDAEYMYYAVTKKKSANAWLF